VNASYSILLSSVNKFVLSKTLSCAYWKMKLNCYIIAQRLSRSVAQHTEHGEDMYLVTSADGFSRFGLCAMVTWLNEYVVRFAYSFPPATEYKVLKWFVDFNMKCVFALCYYYLPRSLAFFFLKVHGTTIYTMLKGIPLTSRAGQVWLERQLSTAVESGIWALELFECIIAHAPL